MTYRLLSLFVALCWSLQASAQVDAALIRLVPQVVLPPTPVPTSSYKVDAMNGVQIVSTLPLKVALEFETRKVGAEALVAVAKQGQKGALLKIRVADVPIGADTPQYLVGTGVQLVGVGPSAMAVLHVVGPSFMEVGLPPGGTLNYEISHYLWLEPEVPGTQGAALTVSRFDIAPLDQFMLMTRATEASRRALDMATAGAYLQDYGQMLAATAKAEQDRVAVDALLKSRQDAVAKLSRVEQELTTRMQQAAKASRAAATWGTLSTVFSLGASIALASSMAGTDLKNPDGTTPTSRDQLNQALTRVSTESVKQVDVLTNQAKGLIRDVDAINRAILNQGAQQGVSLDPQAERHILQLY